MRERQRAGNRLPALGKLERAKGIEPSYTAWEAVVLPLNYARDRLLLKAWSFLDPPSAASREGTRRHLPNSAGVSLQRPTRWSLCGVGKVFGTHRGFRADSVGIEGRFRASPEAAVLNRAALFDGSTIPVTARFSDSDISARMGLVRAAPLIGA